MPSLQPSVCNHPAIIRDQPSVEDAPSSNDLLPRSATPVQCVTWLLSPDHLDTNVCTPFGVNQSAFTSGPGGLGVKFSAGRCGWRTCLANVAMDDDGGLSAAKQHPQRAPGGL